MHCARERPEDALGTQVFAFLLGDVRPRRQIVPAAEMPIAGAGQDCAADVAILPEVDPGRGNSIRCGLVEDVRLLGVVQRDVGDPVALFVIDRQAALPFSLPRAFSRIRIALAEGAWKGRLSGGGGAIGSNRSAGEPGWPPCQIVAAIAD